ncbi:MAG: hypothetical protein ACYCT7_03160 [bacterium]
MSVLKYIIKLLIIVGAIFCLILLFNIMPIFNGNKSNDPVEIANTFIVFVTFIVVIATVIISIIIAIYIKQYAMAKERLLTENIDEVVKVFGEKPEIRQEFLSKMLNSPIVRDAMDNEFKKMALNINEQIKNIGIKVDGIQKETNNNKKEIENNAVKINALRAHNEPIGDLKNNFFKLKENKEEKGETEDNETI